MNLVRQCGVILYPALPMAIRGWSAATSSRSMCLTGFTVRARSVSADQMSATAQGVANPLAAASSSASAAAVTSRLTPSISADRTTSDPARFKAQNIHSRGLKAVKVVKKCRDRTVAPGPRLFRSRRVPWHDDGAAHPRVQHATGGGQPLWRSAMHLRTQN